MKQTLFTLVILFLVSTLFPQVSRKVVIEHFTNSRCSTCASQNPAFYDLLQNYPNVLHIAYHPSSPYASCIFSMYNPTENDARTNFYGIYGSTPKLVLQGDLVGFQNPIIQAEQIENQLGQMSDYEVRVTQKMNSSTNAEVTLVVKRVNGNTEESLNLYVGLVEKLVNYNAPNGETYHPDVFRKVIYNQALPSLAMGDSAIYVKNYTFDSEWVNDEMYAFGLVQKNDDKEILQAAASRTVGEGPSGLTEYRNLNLGNVFYPNPASDLIHLQPEFSGRFEKIDFFDLTGNKIAEFSDPNNISIDNLASGLYFVQLSGKNNEKYSTKIMVTKH